MKLCDRLKNYRKEQNLTQQELANKLFVSRSAVAKWEQDRGYPDKATLEVLGELLGVTQEQLITTETIKDIALGSINVASKQNRITFIMCITLAVITLFSIFMGVYLFVPKDEEKPTVTTSILKETAYMEFDENHENVYLFSTYKYSSENKSQLYENIPNLFSSSVPCYDVYGEPMNFYDLRDGYKVMAFINQTKTKFKNKFTVTYSADKIVVLDDYLEGDYYIKGFFISTETYYGDYPPIYAPELGYTEYKPFQLDSGLVYELAVGNKVFFPYDRYPIFLSNGENTVYYPNSPLLPKMSLNPDVFKNPLTGYTCKSKQEVNITLSPNTQEVLIYALDNSEKGYTLYDSAWKSGDMSFVIDFINFSNTDATKRHIEITLNVTWPTTDDYVVIQEFDQNNTLIKTSCLVGKHEEERTFKLEDNTAYVLASKNSNTPELLKRGDKILLNVSTRFGYVVPVKYTLS